jgi:hypothetical protein
VTTREAHTAFRLDHELFPVQRNEFTDSAKIPRCHIFRQQNISND